MILWVTTWRRVWPPYGLSSMVVLTLSDLLATPSTKSWENKECCKAFFYPPFYITSVQLYWSNLSQTSPDLRGGGIDPTSQWGECQRTWGPCQKWPQLWLFLYAGAHKWHPPLWHGTQGRTLSELFLVFRKSFSPLSLKYSVLTEHLR